MNRTAIEIVEELQRNGFEAYFAGGSVRDILLGVEPKDFDIATSATPDEIQKIFPDNIALGKEFGVILVKKGGHGFEVATFREEGPYLDKRRPSFVKFTSAREDALRRDFTINGMFYNPTTKEIIDYVGGQEDLKKKIIRFIGEAAQRIKEDNLRLLRAIRFKVTLDFKYSNNTFEIIRNNSGLIENVSIERVRDELNKIFQSEFRDIGLKELIDSGIIHNIIPEIEEMSGVPQPLEYHHEGDVLTHTTLAIKSLPSDAPIHLIWAVLLHDIAKPKTLIRENDRIIFHNHAQESAQMAKQILKRLKFSNIEISTICYLIENHMKIATIPQMRPTKQMAFLLDHGFPDLIKLCEADSKGTYPINLSLVEKLQGELEVARQKNEEIERVKKKKNLFTGDNLLKLGYNPSHQFKQILDDVNDQIISGKLSSSADIEEYVLDNYKK